MRLKNTTTLLGEIPGRAFLIYTFFLEYRAWISLYAGYFVSIVLSVCSCYAMLLIYVLKLSTVCSQTDLESDYVKRF